MPSSSSRTACTSISRKDGRARPALRDAWMAQFEAYKAEYPELADQLYRMQHRQLPEGWDKDIPVFPADAKGVAGRDASAKVLNAVAKNVPWLIGGSADLAPSTKTRLTFEGAGDFDGRSSYGGRNLHFGIREHAMGVDPQRHGPVEDSAVWFGLPDFQRLRPAADPPERDHGNPGHLHLHARFDRRRRRRPDAPADRATGFAARHSRPDHAAPRRRQRSGRGVARHHATAARAGLPDPVAPGYADARPHQVRPRLRSGQGRVYAADARTASPTSS